MPTPGTRRRSGIGYGNYFPTGGQDASPLLAGFLQAQAGKRQREQDDQDAADAAAEREIRKQQLDLQSRKLTLEENDQADTRKSNQFAKLSAGYMGALAAQLSPGEAWAIGAGAAGLDPNDPSIQPFQKALQSAGVARMQASAPAPPGTPTEPGPTFSQPPTQMGAQPFPAGGQTGQPPVGPDGLPHDFEDIFQAAIGGASGGAGQAAMPPQAQAGPPAGTPGQPEAQIAPQVPPDTFMPGGQQPGLMGSRLQQPAAPTPITAQDFWTSLGPAAQEKLRAQREKEAEANARIQRQALKDQMVAQTAQATLNERVKEFEGNLELKKAIQAYAPIRDQAANAIKQAQLEQTKLRDQQNNVIAGRNATSREKQVAISAQQVQLQKERDANTRSGLSPYMNPIMKQAAEFGREESKAVAGVKQWQTTLDALNKAVVDQEAKKPGSSFLLTADPQFQAKITAAQGKVQGFQAALDALHAFPPYLDIMGDPSTGEPGQYAKVMGVMKGLTDQQVTDPGGKPKPRSQQPGSPQPFNPPAVHPAKRGKRKTLIYDPATNSFK